MALLFLDVDHFKSINDRFGHAIGDQALKFVAGLLTQQVRVYDLVGRWGGEEFLIVLPDTTLVEAGTVAERIRQAIAAASLLLNNGTPVTVTASLGVTHLTDPAQTLPDVVGHADEALYRAKHEGRNRVCLYTPEAKAA